MLAKAISDRDVSEAKRREAEIKAAELAVKWGFTAAAVTSVFKIAGEQNVSEENAPAKLIEIASHFAQTQAALAALEPDDPRAAELARHAKEAFDVGQLVEADTLLDRAKELEAAALREARRLLERAQQALDRHGLNLAKMEATQGDIALTQVRYAEAADHFNQAVSLVPPGHEDDTVNYLNGRADALYRQGNERGDNSALTEVIAVVAQVLKLQPRDHMPLQWAEAQRDLGLVLETLGARESGTYALRSWLQPIGRRSRRGRAKGCRATGRKRKTTSATCC